MSIQYWWYQKDILILTSLRLTDGSLINMPVTTYSDV